MGKLLRQIDLLTSGTELTGVEMSSDMLQQIDTSRFQNPVRHIVSGKEMICRFKNFLYEGKYIDKRKNVEIEFFDSAQSIIDKINSENNLSS